MSGSIRIDDQTHWKAAGWVYRYLVRGALAELARDEPIRHVFDVEPGRLVWGDDVDISVYGQQGRLALAGVVFTLLRGLRERTRQPGRSLLL